MIRLPQLPTLQSRERLLAVASGAVLLVVLLDLAVLRPWTHHTRQVHQEIRQLEQTLHAHRKLLVRQAAVMAEAEQYQRYLTPALADDLQMAALLKEVEALAVSSSVRISEIKSLGVEAEEAAKRYTLEVRFVCGLEEWVGFVVGLEQSSSLFAITRAGLSVEQDKREHVEGSLRLVSTAFRQEAAAEPAAGGAHVATQ